MHLTIHLSDGWLDEDDDDGEAKNRGIVLSVILYTRSVLVAFMGRRRTGRGITTSFLGHH